VLNDVLPPAVVMNVVMPPADVINVDVVLLFVAVLFERAV
jgi:hypothetical protein